MEGFVAPAYGESSLGDVVPAVGRALGVGVPTGTVDPTGLVLPEAASYVVFLVDGLGSRLLERYAHAAPYLSSLRSVAPSATAGVPSTTATSLTSLGTGLVPTALKLAASDLAALPLPDEGPAWDEAARATAAAQAAATAGDLDGWRAGVEAAADAVLGAQRLGAGDRTATLAWWRSRLGRRPRLAP